ncbi:MAG: hypothetical protein JWP75_309 [Frondihabitans sp.]|nr:hypothetical protein [Frondihabitans sp.]
MTSVSESTGRRRRVVLVNPLAGTLTQYTTHLARSLRASGHEVHVEHVAEPSHSGGSRLSWLRSYAAAVLRARKTCRSSATQNAHRPRVIVTWPVLGYLDLFLLRLALGRRCDSWLVMHDPQPLVRAVGYSGVIRRTALRVMRRPALIVHSVTAHEALREQGAERHAEILPLPVNPKKPGSITGRDHNAHLTVRVFGQFKPDRDVELLARIATRVPAGSQLEIHGRGWPAVEGWQVTDAFVPEERLDRLIATSDVVVIPYKRFFQSAVAYRCLETGTPVVGSRNSSLVDLYPSNSPLLVSAGHDDADEIDRWVSALMTAKSLATAEVLELAHRADERCTREWGRFAHRH